MGLQFLLDSQKKFQKKLGYDIDSMNLQEKTKYIKEQILWSTDELHEMLHELPFAKDWSTKYYKMPPEYLQQQIELSKYEFIDFLHFAANIAVALGLDENEIIELYKKKNKINYERQKNGY